MGHKCILTLALLAFVIYYAKALQGQGSTRSRSNASATSRANRQSSLTSSRGGEPAAPDLQTNMVRVRDTVNDDPCRKHQREIEQRERERRERREARRTNSRGSQDTGSPASGRGSRTSHSPRSPKSQAVRQCASAVNAYIALPNDYKTNCPSAFAADCVAIDGDLTCVVVFRKSWFGCLPSKGTLSLGKCAQAVMSYFQLAAAAWQTPYGRSTNTPIRRGGGQGRGSVQLTEGSQRGSGQLTGGEGRRSSPSGSSEIRPADRSGPSNY